MMTKSVTPFDSPRTLLDAVYEELGYQNGELLNTLPSPPADSKQANAWLEKGDWLSIASKIGSEKIFFVNEDPVIIFHEAPTTDDDALREIFRQIWCMGRPQCLFIAAPGELRIYSLNQPPVHKP